MKKLTMMALLACCVAAAGTAQTMAAETEADIISNETEADIISAEGIRAGLSENFKYLDRLCKYSPYIAIGGIAPIKATNVRDKFLSECFSIIPKTHKVHLFGVSTLDLLDKYWDRISSADSSTWYFAAINGELLSDYGRLIVSENRNAWDKSVVDYIENQGYSFEAVATDVNERIKFNLDFLKRWLKERETQNSPYRDLTQLGLF